MRKNMISNQKYLLHFASPSSGNTPTAIISLSGDLDFGSVEVGNSSTATLTISNLGTAALTVSGIILPDDLSASWSSGEIAPADSQSVTLSYTPTAEGLLSDSLVVSSDATSGISARSVSGTATPAPELYDSDASAYFDAVEASAAPLSETQMDAFNAFVLSCKSAGLWNKIDALYPFIGGSAPAHAINARNPANFSIVWYGNVTHNENGIIGDGSTSYADTGLNPATQWGSTTTDAMGAFYCRNGAQRGISWSDGMFDFGAHPADATCFDATLYNSSGYPRYIFSSFRDMNSYGTGLATEQQRGFFCLSRTSATSACGYKNATKLWESTSNMTGSAPDFNVHLMCRAPSGITLRSSRSYSLFIFGRGLSSSEVSDLNTAVQTLQTALGRNV